MLLSCRSHYQYQQFLRGWIPLLWAVDPRRIESFAEPLTKVWVLDLNPAIPLLLQRLEVLGASLKAA